MSSPFVKQLVASDRKTRDAALASLTKFLSSSRQFEELELLKLWKGLFYCFWHSDRTLVQQALATDLSNLCLSVKDNNFLPFLSAFWTTICREWNSIDVLRLDKFYTLLRRFVGVAFQKLYKSTWQEDLVAPYISLLEGMPLSAVNSRIPNGIRYHLADIYLEELANAVPKEEHSDVPISQLIEPFELLITKSPTKSVRMRVMKAIFDDAILGEFGYIMPEEGSDSEYDALIDEELEEELPGENPESSEGESNSDEEFTGFA